MTTSKLASRPVIFAAAASMLFANAAGAQPAPTPESPAIAPVTTMLHYYKSAVRLTGDIGTTSYSWSLPANSVAQCQAIANAAYRSRGLPGIDGGACINNRTGEVTPVVLRGNASTATTEPSSPAVPPVLGLFHYYQSNIRLTGKVGTTSYSWAVNAGSMDQCRAMAQSVYNASSRGALPGIDGGICLNTATGATQSLQMSRGQVTLANN